MSVDGIATPEVMSEDFSDEVLHERGSRNNSRSALTRGRLGRRSLTARLVTGVVALVIVLVSAVGATTYYALRSFLYSRLDQQLSSIASSNERFIPRCFSYGSNRCDFGGGPGDYQAAQTEWLTMLSTSGTPVLAFKSTDFLRLMSLDRHDQRSLTSRSATTRSLTTADGSQLRVNAHTVSIDDHRYVLVTGLSTDETSRALGRVVAVELVIGLAAVALALGATSLGVRRSLRNLYRVTGTAREVATELSPTGSGLERRVPVVEEGTEVGQLAESFNTMLAAVETQFVARVESEQRMRQFLADASHELRTPLTSIRGYAELARMQRAVDGDVPADNLDRIESEGTRMSRLVEDLLMLARGDAAADDPGRTEHVPVDMTGLLDDAVSGSRAAFPDRQIGFDAAPMPVVIGDRDQLLRVVRNLINNAAVHTAAGRPIQVRGMSRDGGVAVEVIDAGPGLPAEEAAHVFERFWRADKARTRARGGSGLGMSIVAAVTAAHGGTVRFDSTVESGSTVTVWLPASSD